MNYDDVAAAFLTPPDEAIPEPVVPTSPARRLRDACEPIATIGWWSRAASVEFDRLGVDFFSGYVWGRAAALGDRVETAVVSSAFGVFDTSLLGAVLEEARRGVARDDVLAARERGASRGLRDASGDVPLDRIEESAARLRSALDAVDIAARPLFGSLRALRAPDDPHGALWRAAELYREHRGDGHLAACLVAGLDQVEMNVLTELWLGYPVGEYSSTRGFAADRIEQAVSSMVDRGWIDRDRALTDAGRAVRDHIEQVTDESQSAVMEELGDDVESLIGELAEISASVLAQRAAPADPRKRAAG